MSYRITTYMASVTKRNSTIMMTMEMIMTVTNMTRTMTRTTNLIKIQGIEVGTRCKIMSWKYGGEVAPWLSHYGQSLDTLDTDSDGMSDIGSYGRV